MKKIIMNCFTNWGDVNTIIECDDKISYLKSWHTITCQPMTTI